MAGSGSYPQTNYTNGRQGVDESLSVAQVARIFGVTEGTVRRWADESVLPAQRTLGGHRRFSSTAVEAKKREMREEGL